MTKTEIKKKIKFSLLRDEPNLKYANRIAKATLDFLDLCANYEGNFTPSFLVDKGWHAFILYTQDYEKYCHKRYNGFLHHQPNFDGQQTVSSKDTVKFMKKHRIKYDKLLWEGKNLSGVCSMVCHRGGDDICKMMKEKVCDCGLKNKIETPCTCGGCGRACGYKTNNKLEPCESLCSGSKCECHFG